MVVGLRSGGANAAALLVDDAHVLLEPPIALLRQYFPNGTDVSKYSQGSLNKIARQLNQRPRKTLAFRTPADTLYDSLR